MDLIRVNTEDMSQTAALNYSSQCRSDWSVQHCFVAARLWEVSGSFWLSTFNWNLQKLSEVDGTAADLLPPPHLVTRCASKGIIVKTCYEVSIPRRNLQCGVSWGNRGLGVMQTCPRLWYNADVWDRDQA